MHNDTTPQGAWICYARPIARGGRRCGYVNVGATQNCSGCGCAWKASEDRRQAGEAAEARRLPHRG